MNLSDFTPAEIAAIDEACEYTAYEGWEDAPLGLASTLRAAVKHNKPLSCSERLALVDILDNYHTDAGDDVRQATLYQAELAANRSAAEKLDPRTQ